MLNISRTKLNFIALLTVFSVVCGMGGWLILHYVFPETYFPGYLFIPIYFYLVGVFSIWCFDACRKKAPQKILLLYLALKVGKMILSVLVASICCVIMRESVKPFLLTFISFYVLYLIYETCFFTRFELNLKRKKINKVENETITS